MYCSDFFILFSKLPDHHVQTWFENSHSSLFSFSFKFYLMLLNALLSLSEWYASENLNSFLLFLSLSFFPYLVFSHSLYNVQLSAVKKDKLFLKKLICHNLQNHWSYIFTAAEILHSTLSVLYGSPPVPTSSHCPFPPSSLPVSYSIFFCCCFLGY